MCKSKLIGMYYILVTKFDIDLNLQEVYPSTIFYIELYI